MRALTVFCFVCILIMFAAASVPDPSAPVAAKYVSTEVPKWRNGVLSTSPEDMTKRWAATQQQVAAARERDSAGVIAAAKRNVLARLRDPSSATFGSVVATSAGYVCGYVNARNGFGGLTGMRGFIAGYAGGDVLFEDKQGAFEPEWHNRCK